MSLQALAMKALLRQLWNDGGRQCGICADPMDLDGGQVDHIIPRSMGGRDVMSNLQAAHRACNIRKGGANRGAAPTSERPYFICWDDVPLVHRAPGYETALPAGGCSVAIRTGISVRAPYRPCRGRETYSGACAQHESRLNQHDLERRRATRSGEARRDEQP